MGLWAMAGFPEGAIAFDQMLGLLGLMMAGLAAGVGIFKRSKVAGLLGVAMLAIVCLMFRPWHGFWPIASSDPDMESINAGYLMQAKWWAVVSVVEVGSVAVVCWDLLREKAGVADEPEPAAWVERWLD